MTTRTEQRKAFQRIGEEAGKMLDAGMRSPEIIAKLKISQEMYYRALRAACIETWMTREGLRRTEEQAIERLLR